MPLSIAIGLVARERIGEPSALVQILREHLRTRLVPSKARRA